MLNDVPLVSMRPPQQEETVLPFRLPLSEEIDGYDSPPNPEIECPITLIHEPTFREVVDRKFAPIVRPLKEAIQNLPTSLQTSQGKTIRMNYDLQAIAGSHALWSLLTPRQHRWIHNGFYLQCSYGTLENGVDFDWPSCTAIAMTIWDCLAVGSGSLEQAQMQPRKFNRLVRRDLEFQVNEVYREGIGVWHRDLLGHRNEVLVRLGAVLRGQDPDVAYATFLASGAGNFLDF